jgi:hypothetical protein
METNDNAHDRVLAILSVLVLVLDMAALFVLGITGLFVIPYSLRFFCHMRSALPGLTRFIVAVPHLVYLLAPILLAAALAVKEFLVRPVARLVINFIALPIILLAVAVIVLALMMPMLSMMQAIR